MAYPGNQQALQDLHWILCEPDGREFLAELVGGRAASKTLNTAFPRGGSMGGQTNLAGMISWNDEHVNQTIAAVAATAAKDGATVEQIQAAVKSAIAEGVIKVAVTVEGGAK